jgi:dihydrofolate reductase
MRKLRYNVAMSLDGFLTDAQGAFDWILDDDAIDFAGLFAPVDTYMLGRLTYETVLAQGTPPWNPGARVYVVSRTLPAGSRDGVQIVHDDPVALASSLRHEAGDGDIWLFGGGRLCATLLAGNQVDTIEITVVPVLLGGGVPLVARIPDRVPLSFAKSVVYPSGMVALYYTVPGAEGMRGPG